MFLCLNIAVHSCEVEPGGVHVSFGLPEFAGFSVKANVKTIVYPLCVNPTSLVRAYHESGLGELGLGLLTSSVRKLVGAVVWG